MSFRSFSVQGATIRGVEAVPVSVEIVISNGLPGFAIVGMADAAIQESRERVKAALRSSGFVMPNEKIVVNLAPGALRKTGSGFDLPIALGILAATGQMDPEVVRHALVVGELSLGGGVRCSAGMLAYQRCAAGLGLELIAGFPDEGFVKIDGLTCKFLERLSHVREPRFIDAPALSLEEIHPSGDYSEVLGHEMAKRALQVAAAGGHGVIMVGPPGSGKQCLRSGLAASCPALARKSVWKRRLSIRWWAKMLRQFLQDGGLSAALIIALRQRGLSGEVRLRIPARPPLPITGYCFSTK